MSACPQKRRLASAAAAKLKAKRLQREAVALERDLRHERPLLRDATRRAKKAHHRYVRMPAIGTRGSSLERRLDGHQDAQSARVRAHSAHTQHTHTQHTPNTHTQHERPILRDTPRGRTIGACASAREFSRSGRLHVYVTSSPRRCSVHTHTLSDSLSLSLSLPGWGTGTSG